MAIIGWFYPTGRGWLSRLARTGIDLVVPQAASGDLDSASAPSRDWRVALRWLEVARKAIPRTIVSPKIKHQGRFGRGKTLVAARRYVGLQFVLLDFSFL